VNELPVRATFSVYVPDTWMRVRTLLTPTSQLIGILLLAQDFPVVLARRQRGFAEQFRLGYHMFVCGFVYLSLFCELSATQLSLPFV